MKTDLYGITVANSEIAGPGEYAISLAPTLRALQKRRPIPPGVAVAFTFGADVALERFWRLKGGRKPYINVPIVSPSFATWLDAAPYEHHVQSLRALIMAHDLAMENAVLPSIPLSPWVRPEFWSTAFSTANDVSIEFGTTNQNQWSRYLKIVEVLSESLGNTKRLIAYGVSRPHKMANILDAWSGPVVFASTEPYMKALLAGHALAYPTLSSAADPSKSRQELVALNARVFNRVAQELIHKYRPRNLQTPLGETTTSCRSQESDLVDEDESVA